MAVLNTRDFTTLTRDMVAAVQSSSTTLLNLTVGSVLRAIIEAVAGIILWLQGIAVYVMTLRYASTSTGSDLDAWMADFGFTRLPAVPATGSVTFSRFTTTAQGLIPLNTLVQTGDGTQQFLVTRDTSNPDYSGDLGSYVIGTSIASIDVPVQAVNSGTQGNVLANTITSIGSALSGIDEVTNASGFTNGVDQEADPSFRLRFVAYLLSLSKATLAAVRYAVLAVRQGLQCTITENETYEGDVDDGFFYVVVNDGTGDPPSDLVDAVGLAVDAVRGLSIRYAVFPPEVVTANVTLTITNAAGYIHSDVVGAVGTALGAFINALPLGETLHYTKIAAVVYAVAGVTNVTAMTLNSGTSDLTASAKQVIKAGTIVVS